MDKPATKLSTAKLRQAFHGDLATFWTSWKKNHPDQNPYALVLLGLEGGCPQFSAHVLTEEGLTRVAQRYVDRGYHDTLDEARKALRYSTPDSPSANEEFAQNLPTVTPLFAPHALSLGDTKGYKLLANAAMLALESLDSEGLFGKGESRERLLLIIITEDTEENWSHPSAKRLNSPKVYQRYESDTKIEGTFAKCDDFALSPDRRTLYARGSRKNPIAKPGSKEEFISEFVAYDLPNLKRRWFVTFPSFGDSCTTLACTPDNNSVIILRVNGGQSQLTQYPANSNNPIREGRCPGNPKKMVISHDGSQIAIITWECTLNILDANFQLLRTLTLDSTLRDIHFLHSGQLLIGTDKSLLILDPKNGQISATLPGQCFRCSPNAAENLLAVSQFFPSWRKLSEDPTIRLLRLPSLELVTKFSNEGHQLVTPALSPDGKLIAFEARDINTPRKFIAVYEISSGNLIARRKSNYINALAFLPDNRTLVIGYSGITTTEPINLWQFSN